MKATRGKSHSFWVDDFFMVRAPLLPCATFLDLGDGLETAARLREGVRPEDLQSLFAGDCQRVRARMQAIAEDDVFREALFVSSEGLYAAVERWTQEPLSKRGAAVERSILKYIQRASTRCTPYGLMSGVGMGRIDDTPSRVEIASRHRRTRHARVDSRILMTLAQSISQNAKLRDSLVYVPNSTAYEAGPRLRYFEAAGHPFSGRTHLVTVANTDVLRKVLASAANGARWSDLVQTIRSCDDEIEEAEAVEFLEEIVQSQILIPDVFPSPVGTEMLPAFVEKTKALDLPADVREFMGGLVTSSRQLNDDPLGHGVATMQKAASLVGGFMRGAAQRDEETPEGGVGQDVKEDGDAAEATEQSVFQVDSLISLTHATLRRESLAPLLAVLDSLYVVNSQRSQGGLLDFMTEFTRRYDDREVSICEALDPEGGIRFGTGQAQAEPSPLLRVPVANQATPRGEEMTAVDRWKLELLLEARAGGDAEIVLTSEEIRKRFPDPGRRPPSPSFSVMVSVLGSSDDLDQGKARFLLVMGGGSHTLNLFGRFAHVIGDEMTEKLRRSAQREQAITTSILAEVAYLPPFKLGNICQGPSMRPYTISYRCPRPEASGDIIPIDDILVSVRGGRVLLRSRSLGTFIQPRIDHAMNVSHPTNPAIFNFLGMLQYQETNTFNGWTWGPLARLPELPRVTIDRVVVSPRVWTIAKDDVETLAGKRKKESFEADGLDAFARVQEWRARLGLPRHVAIGTTTDYLAADLDNPLSVDLMLRELRKSGQVQELFLPEITQAVVGEEGAYTHEIIVPVWSVKLESATSAPAARKRAPATTDQRKRLRFRNGVMFAKIYGGESALDKLLREGLREFVASNAARIGLQNWFFIRYGDPLAHLRLRLFAAPGQLLGVVPVLEELCEKASGVSKLVFDAYEPEIDRYGGPNGIDLVERYFGVDSRYAIELLARYMAPDEEPRSEKRVAGVEQRWLLSALSVCRLLDDFRLDAALRMSFVADYAKSMAGDMGDGVVQQKAFGALYRHHRAILDAAVAGHDPEQFFAPGIHALLEWRSQETAEIFGELQRRAAQDQLVAPLASIHTSLLHMHCNRLFISQQRRQEYVLLQILRRALKSAAGRQRNQESQPKVAEA